MAGQDQPKEHDDHRHRHIPRHRQKREELDRICQLLQQKCDKMVLADCSNVLQARNI